MWWKRGGEKTSCLIPSADAATILPDPFPHTYTVISLFSLVNKIIREEVGMEKGGIECGGTGSVAFPDPLVLRSFHARQREACAKRGGKGERWQCQLLHSFSCSVNQKTEQEWMLVSGRKERNTRPGRELESGVIEKERRRRKRIAVSGSCGDLFSFPPLLT